MSKARPLQVAPGRGADTGAPGEPPRTKSGVRASAVASSEAARELEGLRARVRSLEAQVASLETQAAERAHTEQTLREGLAEPSGEVEAGFKLLVESVSDYAIFRLDPRGIVATWNAGAERIKGYRASEVLGRHFSVFYPPETVLAGHCEWELARAAERGRVEDEGWRVRKDGTRFWADVVLTALRSPSGELVGYAKVTRDLTERRRAEQARVELERMHAAEQRKDEFLAIMGHELRNPLGPLVTAADMIRLRGGRATDREMAIIDRQLRHMTRLVSDLLDASRALRDHVELSPRPVELGEIIMNAVDLASPLLEERGHELLVDVPDHGLMIVVDPERIAQVFGNILNNAAKYTPEGGVIELRAERRGADVRVTIQDDGQGIAPAMLTRIFDLFTQGEEGLERAGGGLGIGLAIARKVVRAHDGDLWAESDGLGRGSRFTICLPARAAKAAEIAEAPEAPESVRELPRAGARRRALLVDDNPDAVELLQLLLERSGYEASIAFDGPAALELAEEFHPDVVFLDIGLPTMSGYEVAARMRELPACADAFIVALTGYARPDDRARAIAAGFSEHLAKPVDLDTLAKTLERARAPR